MLQAKGYRAAETRGRGWGAAEARGRGVRSGGGREWGAAEARGRGLRSGGGGGVGSGRGRRVGATEIEEIERENRSQRKDRERERKLSLWWVKDGLNELSGRQVSVFVWCHIPNLEDSYVRKFCPFQKGFIESNFQVYGRKDATLFRIN